MRVRIIKCSSKNYWYIHLVGEIFEVQEQRSGNCKITKGEKELCLIFAGDWEVIAI